MFSLLRRDRNGSGASVPPGHLVYAVGDIHGRSDLLADLRGRILEDARRSRAHARTIVYLGDYVDRGRGSSDVLDILINEPLPGFQSVHLKGNHEDLMLRFLSAPRDEVWLINGGDATLESYGVTGPWMAVDSVSLADLRRRLQQALPEAHLRFLLNLRPHHTVGDYFFVHAGVRPGIALEQQRPEDLLWIRGRFLDSAADFGKRVVHGHSIAPRPEVRPNRIGIDTGAFATDRLTAAAFEGTDVRFLHT